MKQYIIIVGLIISIISCKTDESYKKTDFLRGDAELSMKIEDPNNSYMKVRSFGIAEHIDMGENNYFTHVIKNTTEGYFTFSDRMHACGFYVKPNSKIHVELDTKDFIRNIKFSGDNVNENNYLKDFFLQKRDLGRKISVQHLAYLEENDFIHLLDSIKEIRYELLKKHNAGNKLDAHFNYLEENRIYYEYTSRLETYEAYRKYALQDSTFTVSSKFYDYRKDVEFDNENLIVVPSFHYYLEGYYQQIANKITEKDSTDVYVNYLKVIGDKVKNKKIKEHLLFSYAIQNLKETNDRSGFIQEYKKFATDTTFVKQITARFLEMNRLNPGEKAPEFEIKDINGKIVKLSDFKGKYVYIDVWATWCAPCVKQMPFLDILKEKYKDEIVFIGISTDSFQGTWEKFLKVNNMKGIQLISGDDENFKDLYKAHSVPKFILINPEGNISTADAPRPSDKEIIEMLFDRIVEWNKMPKEEKEKK